MSLERTKYLRDLRQGMVELFNKEELETVAFDLGIDWDELAGKTKSLKVQNLIIHQARRQHLDDLLTLLAERRPDADWPEDIPTDSKRIKEDVELWRPEAASLIAGLSAILVLQLLGYAASICSPKALPAVAFACQPILFTVAIYGYIRGSYYSSVRAKRLSIAIVVSIVVSIVLIAYIGLH